MKTRSWLALLAVASVVACGDDTAKQTGAVTPSAGFSAPVTTAGTSAAISGTAGVRGQVQTTPPPTQVTTPIAGVGSLPVAGTSVGGTAGQGGTGAISPTAGGGVGGASGSAGSVAAAGSGGSAAGFSQLLSYGFVVYCVGSSTNDGSGTKAALDWTLKQNDDMTSPLYQHLDTSKIAVGGHSLGSIMTFAFLPDPRVTTSVHISGGSFDGMGSTHLKTEAMFMCGPDASADIAEAQCETDYKNATTPIFYTKLKGATHITSARLGWAATIAWLLWHLADQGDQWKKEFLEPTGQFQSGIYMSESKNWP